jgi:hypothetical protein
MFIFSLNDFDHCVHNKMKLKKHLNYVTISCLYIALLIFIARLIFTLLNFIRFDVRIVME